MGHDSDPVVTANAVIWAAVIVGAAWLLHETEMGPAVVVMLTFAAVLSLATLSRGRRNRSDEPPQASGQRSM